MSLTMTVIDSVHGRAAAGMHVRLAHGEGQCWHDRAAGRTDDDGRISRWQPEFMLEPGIYRAELDLDAYFVTLGITPYLPAVVVTFRMFDPEEQCTITLAVAPGAVNACWST